MKKLLILVLVSCVVFASCGKKKKEQKAKETAKIERQIALKKIRNVNMGGAYIAKYVFENKENSIGSLSFGQIPSGKTFIFVYDGKEYSFNLKNNLWGIKKGNKIYLKEGYVKTSRVKFKSIPVVIEEYAETQTKEELLPGITKYPLTPVIILKDGSVYPVYYDLSDFLTNVNSGELVTLRVKPTLSAKFKNQIYLFNSDYKEWTVRPEYKK